MEKSEANQEAIRFFDELWSKGDPWSLESSQFEAQRYAHLLKMIRGRRYARALEIGCGAGAFTPSLADLADWVVALDVSPIAIAKAIETQARKNIDYRVSNVMEFDHRSHEPYDLIVMSETVYYLGWLYSFFDVGWLSSELHAATRVGGELLLANTLNYPDDPLMSPWLIRTYHDLFRNVGYQVDREEIFYGVKDGVEMQVLASILRKTEEAGELPEKKS